MAHTFEFVLHFVRCVTVTVSPNQIIIIIIIIIPNLYFALSSELCQYDAALCQYDVSLCQYNETDSSMLCEFK